MHPNHIELRAQQRAKGKPVSERPKLASRAFVPDMRNPIDRANAVRIEAFKSRLKGSAPPLIQIWSA